MKLFLSTLLIAALLVVSFIAVRSFLGVPIVMKIPQKESSAWVIAGHDEWFTCQSDDECTLTSRPHDVCGGGLYAVNKKYVEELRQILPSSNCTGMPTSMPCPTGFICIDPTSRCANNECIMIKATQTKTLK